MKRNNFFKHFLETIGVIGGGILITLGAIFVVSLFHLDIRIGIIGSIVWLILLSLFVGIITYER